MPKRGRDETDDEYGESSDEDEDEGSEYGESSDEGEDDGSEYNPSDEGEGSEYNPSDEDEYEEQLSGSDDEGDERRKPLFENTVETLTRGVSVGALHQLEEVCRDCGGTEDNRIAAVYKLVRYFEERGVSERDTSGEQPRYETDELNELGKAETISELCDGQPVTFDVIEGFLGRQCATAALHAIRGRLNNMRECVLAVLWGMLCVHRSVVEKATNALRDVSSTGDLVTGRFLMRLANENRFDTVREYIQRVHGAQPINLDTVTIDTRTVQVYVIELFVRPKDLHQTERSAIEFFGTDVSNVYSHEHRRGRKVKVVFTGENPTSRRKAFVSQVELALRYRVTRTASRTGDGEQLSIGRARLGEYTCDGKSYLRVKIETTGRDMYVYLRVDNHTKGVVITTNKLAQAAREQLPGKNIPELDELERSYKFAYRRVWTCKVVLEWHCPGAPIARGHSTKIEIDLKKPLFRRYDVMLDVTWGRSSAVSFTNAPRDVIKDAAREQERMYDVLGKVGKVRTALTADDYRAFYEILNRVVAISVDIQSVTFNRAELGERQAIVRAMQTIMHHPIMVCTNRVFERQLANRCKCLVPYLSWHNVLNSQIAGGLRCTVKVGPQRPCRSSSGGTCRLCDCRFQMDTSNWKIRFKK